MQVILSHAILRSDRQLCSLPKTNKLWSRSIRSLAKLQFIVLTILKFQNVYWYIRNTDFSVILCWNFSLAFRPKAPPTTPRALIWYMTFGGPKWKFKSLSFQKLLLQIQKLLQFQIPSEQSNWRKLSTKITFRLIYIFQMF